MNRTERAIKRACKRALISKKREKRIAIFEMRDAGWYNKNEKKSKVTSLSKEEKGLKKWHRKMLEDYTCRENTLLEAAEA